MTIHAFSMGMYVRTIKRRNKDGSEVEYVQLAHNTRHPEKGYSRAEVVYSFGRRDQLDVAALKRLVSSLSRFISPEDIQDLEAQSAGLKFISSRPAGGALLLKGLWERIGIDRCLANALKHTEFKAPISDAIFAMVANRALAPSSKLAVEEWVAKDVHLDIEAPIKVQHLYRSMDFLLKNAEAIQEKVFWTTAQLLNLTVDLIFFDTTNTYFEMEDTNDSELLAFGKSKHKRDDLPQVTIGLAVTREGIPVRCWVLPGNQNDAKCVDTVQKDLNDWRLGNVIWAMDRGMTSEENRKNLQRAGGQYILGEKLRGPNVNEEALNRGGRFKKVNDNLHIKEVFVGEGSGRRRFVIAYNPEQAEHDKHVRARNLERIETELAALNKRSGKAYLKSKYALLAHRSMGRYLKELKSGKLTVDKAKIKQAEKLDGKYLLSTSDKSLSAEDIALGYKQLMEVERAFRTLKSTLSLRPVYHTKDDRIRSHVLLCWLALLLVRITELETGLSWPRVRAELERLHLGEFLHKDGRVLQYTELTQNQRNLFKKLNIKLPAKIKSIG
ncbi:IS1634 family transposase [uncultured Desulfobacter sp.]|uniref:IS1634 family transposase n=1 Tax=uncultured Desulfobacter sp. TaxID=240139 RepID=UPI002AA72AE7|nr:IS1634 family transposase [uncultured Desulfobacter sp.]